jgi:hypothetical protein
MKTIKLENGLTVATFAPSANFNPLTASAADLAANGFPSMPDDPKHRARYAQVFGQIKNKFTYVEPTFRINADRSHGPRKATAAGTQTSSNWSGGVVSPPSGQSFKWIEGDWIVPDVDAPTEGKWYYCATWIGIDGDGSGDVFQAGVESDVYRKGTAVTKSFYPWWEWYPISEVQITNLTFNPGDMVTMILCSSQGAGSTTGTVFFTNRTTGASTNLTLTAPTGTKLVGNCAEWIVEAPTVGGSQSALADYGEVFFSVAEAVTNTGTTVNGGTGSNINMTAGTSVVSDGNLIAPTIIQCAYEGTLP